MFYFLKKKASFLLLFVLGFTVAVINGCDDSGVEGPTTQNNPDVKSFDSLYIEEDSAAGSSFAGLSLFGGFNTTSMSSSRDVGLAGGTNPTGTDFYLRSGVLDYLMDLGYETRFYRFYTDGGIDTVTVLQPGGTLDSLDFTQEDTYAGGVWNYFNVGDTSKPVYGFYLKGRKAAGENNGVRVYGVISPIKNGDRIPGSPYGYWMTFKIKMNIAGKDDFRKTITVE
jgi:hypothetical protein